jgi:hypothetical protein
MGRIGRGQIVLFLLVVAAPVRGEAGPAEALGRLKAVGREGAGNREAARAWKDVAHLGPDTLPQILAAMDDANATASNWLRTAADAIAERSLATGQALPAAQLEKFVRARGHNGAARRLAYEWLCRVDPSTPKRLLPGMLQDPSPELRRDAVAALIEQAQGQLDKGDKETARSTYQKALTGACDKDQVDAIAKQLDKLGVKVDLAAHFGFIRRWHLLVPFDNPRETGYDTVYPPEKGVDLNAAYSGKNGVKARWTSYTTTDPYGYVDLNKVLGKQKSVVAYAYAVVESPVERPIEVRLGTPNAVKVFLNGKEVFHRNEYHHGLIVDQHRAPALLKAGRNELLVKLCQNDQSEAWAQAWSFHVRLCDAVGAAVPWTLVWEEPKVEAQGEERKP